MGYPMKKQFRENYAKTLALLAFAFVLALPAAAWDSERDGAILARIADAGDPWKPAGAALRAVADGAEAFLTDEWIAEAADAARSLFESGERARAERAFLNLAALCDLTGLPLSDAWLRLVYADCLVAAKAERAKAEALVDRAQAIYRDNEAPLGIADCVRYRGLVGETWGPSDRALADYRSAVGLYEASGDPGGAAYGTAAAWAGIGRCLAASKDHAGAADAFDRAATGFASPAASDPYAAGTARAFAGDAYRNAGDAAHASSPEARAGKTPAAGSAAAKLYAKARERYASAAEFLSEAGDPAGAVDALGRLGDLCVFLGDLPKARAAWAAAEDLCERNGLLPERAYFLQRSADEDRLAGKVAAASAAYREAIACYRASTALDPERRLDFGNALLALAVLVDATGEHREALSLLDDARAQFKASATPGAARGLANADLASGTAAFALGETAAARVFFQLAADAFARSGDATGEGGALAGLARADLREADFPRALERSARARERYAAAKRPGDVAACWLVDAQAALATSDFDAAEKAVNAAREAYRSANAPGGVLACELEAAGILTRRGDLAAAEKKYRGVLADPAAKADPRLRAQALLGLGTLLSRRADASGARASFDEARSLSTAAKDPAGEASCAFGIAELYRARGEYAEAEARYDEAAALYRSAGDLLGEANCLRSAGDVSLARKRYPEALGRYEAALAAFERTKSTLGTANCLHGLGEIALRTGRHDEAKRRFEEAIPLYRAYGSSLGEANCEQSLGDLALDSTPPDPARAEARYRAALALFGDAGDAWSSVYARAGLARAVARGGEPKRAMAELRAAVSEALAVRRRAGVSAERTQYAENVSDTLKRLALELAPSDPAGALEAWEALKGRTFMENLSVRDALKAAGVSAADIERRVALDERLAALSSGLRELSDSARGKDGALAQLASSKRSAERDVDALEAELGRRYPRYAELRESSAPALGASLACLAGDEAALVYATVEDRTGAWIAKRDGTVKYFEHDKEQDLHKAVGEYRASLLRWVQGSRKLGETRPAERLAVIALVILPSKASFGPDVSSLVVVPDGDLCLLPWDALPYEGARFGQRFSTSYAPSLAVLARLRSPNRDYSKLKRVPVLAFGGAHYSVESAESGGTDASAGEAADLDGSRRVSALADILDRGFRERRWEDLPGAEREAIEVAAIHYADPKNAQAALFRGIMASEPVVKKLGGPGLSANGKTLRLADAKTIHFACHGESVPDLPETSRLLLTQPDAVPAAKRQAYESLEAPGRREDGSLLAAEIVALETKADLVVLSACETAMGKVTATEGVIGLTQAWMTSGANGVVVSLWPVSDDATRVFMVIFHSMLASGASPRDAMRTARDALADGTWPRDARWKALLGAGTPTDYSNPYYYAAFQYWGK